MIAPRLRVVYGIRVGVGEVVAIVGLAVGWAGHPPQQKTQTKNSTTNHPQPLDPLDVGGWLTVAPVHTHVGPRLPIVFCCRSQPPFPLRRACGCVRLPMSVRGLPTRGW